MQVNFDARAINRGITRTAKSLQTPNDRLGQTLLQRDANAPVEIKEIMQNSQLVKMAQDFYNKFVK